MHGDRRHNPRFPCLLVGEARPAGAPAFEVVCTNICRSGGFMSSRVAVNPTTPMTIVFRAASGDTAQVECAAEVMWVSPKGGYAPPGFGVRIRSFRCSKGEDSLRAFAAEHLHWIDLPSLPTDSDGRAWLRIGADGRVSDSLLLPAQQVDLAAAVAARPESAPAIAPAHVAPAEMAKPIEVPKTARQSSAPGQGELAGRPAPRPISADPPIPRPSPGPDSGAAPAAGHAAPPADPGPLAQPIGGRPSSGALAAPIGASPMLRPGLASPAIAPPSIAPSPPPAAKPDASAPRPISRPGLAARPAVANPAPAHPAPAPAPQFSQEAPTAPHFAPAEVAPSRGVRAPGGRPRVTTAPFSPTAAATALPTGPLVPPPAPAAAIDPALEAQLAGLFDPGEENGPTVALDPSVVHDLLAAARAAAAPHAADEDLPADAVTTGPAAPSDTSPWPHAAPDPAQAAKTAPGDFEMVAAPDLPEVGEDALAELLQALDAPTSSPPAAAAPTPYGWRAVDNADGGFGSSWEPPSAATMAAIHGTGAPAAATASYDPHDEMVAPGPLAQATTDPEHVANPTVNYGPAAAASAEYSAAAVVDVTVADGLSPAAQAMVDGASQADGQARAPKESTVAYVRNVKPTPPPALQEHTSPRTSNVLLAESTVTLLPSTLHPVLDQWPQGVPRAISSRYEQLQRIGQGGHGVVYRAVDKMLDRFVVLKFLLQSSLSTEMARKYFMREVRLSASLNHPNIVHIYDIGNTDGVLWYAMEYVDGVTLAQYLLPGQPVADMGFLYSAFSQLCEALDHAHSQGILHRDVKPDNALVASDGAVKLFDFGLARVADHGFGDQSLLLGTPFFMAPEQLTGGKVDHRADVYALGVLLYRMLAGELPFRDGNIFAAHVLEPVPDPRRLNPRLNDSTVALLMRMLAKKPEERPDSCRPISVELWQTLFG